ncbi:MAG: hypothetical protein IT336_06200 [Thermomicrobiales bacterium]|nr:hypothetical protein [Thermomicrobiales bacterium]
MSEELPSQRVIDAIPEDAPGDPGEVASAARSCSVLLIILAALALIVCIGVAISLLN